MIRCGAVGSTHCNHFLAMVIDGKPCCEEEDLLEEASCPTEAKEPCLPRKLKNRRAQAQGPLKDPIGPHRAGGPTFRDFWWNFQVGDGRKCIRGPVRIFLDPFSYDLVASRTI